MAQTPPVIEATPNGPYRVTGVSRIVWREPVTTAEGEPVTWRDVATVTDADDEYWLCRCGHSTNKPFCDSSHRRVEFQAPDAADPGPRAERAKEYGSGQVRLVDDRGLCVHTGFCSTKLTNAWKLAQKELDAAGQTQVVGMAQHCPSGALTVTVDGDDAEPHLAAEIVVIPDGPLWATGGVQVVRSDGTTLEVRNRVTLCRCGASETKPLCDGSHSKIGFSSRPAD
jgi:CDGSH-type Zn-finger protein